MGKMKERGKRKAELADRKSAASQNRMRNIASLTGEQAPTRKRKRKTEEGAHILASRQHHVLNAKLR